jgi:MoxR-like ATPase
MGTTTGRPSLSGALGICGWADLDPVFLAALATEAPVLLVGEHGTAKTLFVERLAEALGLQLRHYNASLLNYDDLVGIPVPDEAGTGLRFCTTPGAIWDAELVFFDEVSRCRPDLQNKLFPIIHERRVNGVRLHRLRHRWAAMNPPAPEDPADAPATGPTYLGAEPLDPALCDRFPYVVRVPRWADLRPADRRRVVAGTVAPNGAADRVRDLVAATRSRLDHLRTGGGTPPWAVEWALQFVTLLAAGDLACSPRRARMLAEALIAVDAARRVLGLDGGPEQAAELVADCCLPQYATEAPPSAATVLAAHRQAWSLTDLTGDETQRRILTEDDPLERVRIALEAGAGGERVSQLVTRALNDAPSRARQTAWAVALFLALRDRADLEPSAWAALRSCAEPVLTPHAHWIRHTTQGQQELWHRIVRAIRDRGVADARARLEANFLLAGYPELFGDHDWRTELEALRDTLDRFEVRLNDGDFEVPEVVVDDEPDLPEDISKEELQRLARRMCSLPPRLHSRLTREQGTEEVDPCAA